jgi:hypothetical protein
MTDERQPNQPSSEVPNLEQERPPGRFGDATPDIGAVQKYAGAGTWVWKDYFGNVVEDPQELVRDPVTQRVRHVKAAVPLTEVEQQNAASRLRKLLDHTQSNYHALANLLLQKPESLWLLPELEMMIIDDHNKAVEEDYHYDIVDEFAEAILEDPANQFALAEYEEETAESKIVQALWNEVEGLYDERQRLGIINLLSQLSTRQAEAVSSLMLVWMEDRDLEDPETRAQLYANLWQEVYSAHQTDLGDQGALGQVFDTGVRTVTQAALNVRNNVFYSDPDEAARKGGLTLGRGLMYGLGVRPPDEAGAFGMWNLGSGAIDAWSFIGLDPVNWLAGLGFASKAAKTIPLARSATNAGRTMMAIRSLLPRQLAGQTSKVMGGRVARMAYSFTAKTYDELVEGMVKSGVAGDLGDIIRRGDHALLLRKYPQFANMPDYLKDSIAKAHTPEEIVEIMRSANVMDALHKVDDLDIAEKAMRESAEAFARSVDTQRGVGRIADDVDGYTPEQVKRMQELLEQGVEATPGFRYVDDPLGEVAKVVTEADETISAFTHGGENFFLRFVDAVTPGRPAAGGLPSVPGRSRPIWYVQDEAGRIVGTYSPDLALFAHPTAPKGLMHAALEASETGGRSFLPTLMNRLDEGAQFSEDGARFLGNAIESRLVGNKVSRGDDLIQHADIGNRDLLMKWLNDRATFNALRARPEEAFIISDVPHRIPKANRGWRSVQGSGRFKQGVRRAGARLTPHAKAPDSIHLFDARKGAKDIDSLLGHLGVEQSVIDSLINRFVNAELGNRMNVFMDEIIPAIGDATGNPLIQSNLLPFFKNMGVRGFSASGVDTWTDAAGAVRRGPIIVSQLTDKIPIPLNELDAVMRRWRAISNRGTAAKALGLRGRGMVKGTRDRRQKLVDRFRAQLSQKGVDTSKISEDELWQMAYSYVAPGDVLTDGRGLAAGWAAPKAGSAWNKMHGFFTKNMLVTRGIQWAWRVSILEENIRAAIFNLPSLYRNPYGYMADMRAAHYLSNLKKWRARNLDFANDVRRTFFAGTTTLDDATTKLRKAGLYDDVVGDTKITNIGDLRELFDTFVDNAVRSRTRINKLKPIQKVGWATRNRARNVERGEAALKKFGLPDDFDLIDDVQDIQLRLANVYLAGTVGHSSIRPAQWLPGMTDEGATVAGRTWGASIIQFTEDAYGKMAVRRIIAKMRGERIPATVDAEGIVNNSRWKLMKGQLQQMFPEHVGDDVALARRYMTDVLEPEIMALLRPALAETDPSDIPDILETLVTTRRLKVKVGGSNFDINMSGGNVGKATRDFGDMAATARVSQAFNDAMPANIPAPAFDPRFMAVDDKGIITALQDRALQFFGESVTQVMNRRPAWIREYNRWYKHYKALDIPEARAVALAQDHATNMINHVYYNIAEAPWLVEKLNRFIPFFGATYEVLSTWTYKMPQHVGGYWATGVPEFVRKIQRMMDAMVNLGIVTRVEEEDGTIRHELHLTPREMVAPDGTIKETPSHPNEIGKFLRGIGFEAVHGVEEVIASLAGMEDGLGIREGGYAMSLGDPFDFRDYGVLSYAQVDIGLNPAVNFVVSKLAGAIPGAGDRGRVGVLEGGETLADLTERLDVDVYDLARLNRGVIFDVFDKETYDRLLAGHITPDELRLPGGMAFEVPDTDLWSTVIEDFITPFGTVDDITDLPMNFIPGVLRWGLMSMGIGNTPTDKFYLGEFDGVMGGFIPDVNQAQMTSQASEAFMYVESHKRYPNGEGRFERILRKTEELNELLQKAKVTSLSELAGSGLEAEANALQAEIEMESEEFLNLVKKTSAESMFLRMMSGQLMPASPRHVRQEQEVINSYWNSLDYAENVKVGKNDLTIQPFSSMEEIEGFFDQVGAWLVDSSGDTAQAHFARQNPTITAYLTPKTYWGDSGVPPEITSFEEHMDQIIAGERITAPLHVTMFRARSSAIQAEFYNEYVARFGNDPVEAAALALNDYQSYQELVDQRSDAYRAMYMQDDMYGGHYDEWQRDRAADDSFTLDQVQEQYDNIRDNLGIVLELEAEADNTNLGLDDIGDLRRSLKAAIAKINQSVRDYESLSERENFRNPFEDAVNNYFKEIYIPYQQGLSDLYDQLAENPDSEQQSIIYELIRIYRNDWQTSALYLSEDGTHPFPAPANIQWERRTDDEKALKITEWLTRPISWIDLEGVTRIVEQQPDMANYLPTDPDQFSIYRNWTLEKVKIDELYESQQITTGIREKILAELENQVRQQLTEQGRGGEVTFMDMTPYEKLELAGHLDPSLGIFGDWIRYNKEALNAAGITAASKEGRVLVNPLYERAKMEALANPRLMDALLQIGEDVYDTTALDRILPEFFFGVRQEQ